MAQPVPYTGAPEVSGRELLPRDEPTPSENIQASPAAFGVNVGEAEQGLGRTTAAVGSELFDRAYAMQQLHETASANAALSDAQNQSLDKFVNYTQLEGKQAVDAYPNLVTDLDKVRADTRANLGSPIAQQMFDQESRQSEFRMKMSGAFHAAEENKKYVVGASKASVQSAINGIDTTPNDQGAYDAGIAKIRTEIDHQMAVGGIGPNDPQYTNAMQTEVSKAVYTRATALARNDPIAAQKFLDKAAASKDIIGADLDKASGYIRSQLLTVGSRQVADQAYSHVTGNGPLLSGLLGNESGGRNIYQGNIGDVNNVIANATGNKDALAQGYFQITGPTWRQHAVEAGIDPLKYPSPMVGGATYAQQAAVASVIPLREWGGATKRIMESIAAKNGGTIDVNKTLGQNLAANGEGFGAGVKTGGPDVPPTLAERVATARGLAEQNHPGDTEFADATQARTEALYASNLRITREAEFQNRQSIESVLVNGTGPDNKIPTTVEELTQDPKAKAAWDQMLPSDQRKYMGVLAQNAKGNVAWNNKRLETYQGLIGEATHDPEKFQNEDFLSMDLPEGAKKELINKRAAVFQKADADPNLSRALALPGVKSQLDSLGLTMQGDKANLFLFSGAYQDELKAFAADNNRQPNAEESQEIATKLLQPLATGGWWGKITGGSTPFFEADVPQDWADKAKAAAQQQNGYTPSDAELSRWYIQMQYQATYGNKSSGPVKPPPGKWHSGGSPTNPIIPTPSGQQ